MVIVPPFLFPVFTPQFMKRMWKKNRGDDDEKSSIFLGFLCSGPFMGVLVQQYNLQLCAYSESALCVRCLVCLGVKKPKRDLRLSH